MDPAEAELLQTLAAHANQQQQEQEQQNGHTSATNAEAVGAELVESDFTSAIANVLAAANGGGGGGGEGVTEGSGLVTDADADILASLNPENQHQHQDQGPSGSRITPGPRSSNGGTPAPSNNGSTTGQAKGKGKGKAKAEGDGLTPEEKKIKQREANRKAAERSRGKKRVELSALEQTINHIQNENTQLRKTLEGLLANVKPGAASGVEGMDIDTSFSIPAGGGGQGAEAVAPSQGDEPMEVDPIILSSQQQQQQPAYLGSGAGSLGSTGLNLPLLTSLYEEISSLRHQIQSHQDLLSLTTPVESSEIDGNGQVSASGEGVSAVEAGAEGEAGPSTPTQPQQPTLQESEEKQSLLSLIAQLQTERTKLEGEKSVLKRGVEAKRARDELSLGFLAEGDEEGLQIMAGTLGEVGAERALIEIRGWLEGALKGWKENGILIPPSLSAPKAKITRKPRQSTNGPKTKPKASSPPQFRPLDNHQTFNDLSAADQVESGSHSLGMGIPIPESSTDVDLSQLAAAHQHQQHQDHHNHHQHDPHTLDDFDFDALMAGVPAGVVGVTGNGAGEDVEMNQSRMELLSDVSMAHQMQ